MQPGYLSEAQRPLGGGAREYLSPFQNEVLGGDFELLGRDGENFSLQTRRRSENGGTHRAGHHAPARVDGAGRRVGVAAIELDRIQIKAQLLCSEL